MDKKIKIYYETFNSKALEFINDLIESFPEFKEQFLKAKTGLNFVSTLDYKTPCNIYKTYVYYKYEKAIKERNEEIFLERDIVYDYDNRDEKQYWDSFISNIKEIWKTLDDTNKNIIWDYFNILNTVTKLTLQTR